MISNPKMENSDLQEIAKSGQVLGLTQFSLHHRTGKLPSQLKTSGKVK